MLVKLVNGASVNPETLKHIYIENKPINGKKTWIVQVKLDDNTIHPIAFLSSKEDNLRRMNYNYRLLGFVKGEAYIYTGCFFYWFIEENCSKIRNFNPMIAIFA